jgi:hypothetical protein
VHDNEGTPLGVESSQRSVEQVSLGNQSGDVADRLDVEGTDLDFHRAPPAATSGGETGANGQAIEPGVEPIRIAQTRQVTPGSDQCLLDGILREDCITKDEARGPVEARGSRLGEDGKGVMIALPRPFHETTLVHARLRCGAAPAVAL